MRRPLLRLVWMFLALFAAPAAADTINFAKGSLIIPMQANFQTPCGSLSAYGLAYRLLQANAPGGYFDPGTHPTRHAVTLYWAVGAKNSPNRCIPTNLNLGPDGTSTVSSTGSPGWNDGCDFKITNTADQPVVPVDYSLNPWTSGAKTGIFPSVALPMRTPSVIGADPYRAGASTLYLNVTSVRTKGTTGIPTITSPLTGITVTPGAITVTGNAPAGMVMKLVDGNGNAISVKLNSGTTANGSTVTSWTMCSTGATCTAPGTYSVTFTPKGTNLSSSSATPSASTISLIYVSSAIPYAGSGTPGAVPSFPAKTLTAANGFTTIQYLGGPFIIEAADAQEVIEFLENGDGANTTIALNSGAIGAPSVNVLSEFTGSNASYGTLSGRPGGYFDQCTGPLLTINGRRPNGTPSGTDHYVTMHQATTSFTANIARRINVVPPKIALVDSNSNGDGTGSRSLSGLEILDSYLGNAGLYYVNTTANKDSGGCPAGTKSSCSVNGKKSGFIYDRFDADADLLSWTNAPNGILNLTDATTNQLIYGVIWTPHWEATHNPGKTTYSYLTGTVNAGVSGLNNIAAFLDNKGTGLMGECASIGSYEGTTGDFNLSPALATPNTSFLFKAGVIDNGLSTDDGTWEGMNCTDPNYPNNTSAACTTIGGAASCGSADNTGGQKACVYWDNVTSEFSQIGDFHFVQTSGYVDDFKPDYTNGSDYKPGIAVLATTWTNYRTGDYPSGGGCNVKATDGTCNNHWDIMALGHKDNDPAKGAIVYVAGHDYQVSTVGSRIILNTLLNLGQNPQLSERALSAPTAYVDPNGAKDSAGATAAGPVPLVFSGVYDVTSGVSASRYTYNWGSGSQWLFPKIPGNVYEHPLVKVGSVAAFNPGSIAFSDIALWDAQAQVTATYKNGAAATKRNLFTYFGGSVVSDATTSGYPNRALQKGWVPSPVSPAEVTKAGCVDILKWGKVDDGKHPAYFGLVVAPSPADGVCDIEEATQLIPMNGGTDFGSSEWTTNQSLLTSSANRAVVQGMLQVVQGSCFATSTKADGTGTWTTATTDSGCNAAGAAGGGTKVFNYPIVGGILHSTPAVVGPSPNIPDNGASRPTVLYAAGADGEVHAFYVSGGTGYKGPQAAITNINTNAATVFQTDWMPSGSFSTAPKPMSELWAFMPASQLPLLASNNQMVDSAPVVQDVFGDFTGTGINEWRTLLVATSGGPLGSPGAEVFAIDVTNPLKPALLWDLNGAWTGPTNSVSPSPLAVNATPAPAAGVGNRWDQPSTGTPTSSSSGVYDYGNLGATYGLSLGEWRVGTRAVFGVFLASNLAADAANAPDTNGIQVAAIDAVTGQKIWQWVHPYSTTDAHVLGNPVPQPVTVMPNPFGALSTLYVGDMEGKLWELDATNGKNATSGFGVASSSGAIFTTGGNTEPITTPVTVAQLPTIKAPAALAPWSGNRVALAGTDGSPESWIDPDGDLHVINLDPSKRDPSTKAAPADPAAPFPLTFPGMRVYGQISVVGETAFVSVAQKAVSDPLSIDTDNTGGTYQIDLGGVTSSFNPSSLSYFSTQALYGGVTVLRGTFNGQTGTRVIGSQVSQLSQVFIPDDPTTKNQSSLSVNQPPGGMLYQLVGWLRRLL